ncbi:MAG TPA: hypothetical protein VMW38_02535 [Terriglobia bacterium]|nr:hypothetical protein [Terriglobia bacterium]
MDQKLKRRLIWLGIVVMIIGLRVACVFYQRSQPARVRPVTQRTLDKDYLVVVPKFYVDDLISARKLIGSTLWVKAGYRAAYFQWVPSTKPGPSKPTLLFEPMESFIVGEVRERPAPLRSGDREVLFVFEKGGQSFATIVGFYSGKDQEYQIQLDDLFFSKNPTEVYAHWSPQVWGKVRAHQLEKGMSFAQVSLSIGDGQLITTGAGGAQVYEFDRKPGGLPGKTRVRFVDGKVEEIEIRG